MADLPFTDVEDTIIDTVETEILSFDPNTGDFIRGFNVTGFAAFRARLKINGTQVHDSGSLVSIIGVAVDAGYPFTPLILTNGQLITITIERAGGSANITFQATIY